MKEFAWNNVIWTAIQSLSDLRTKESKYSCIDDIFFASEKELIALKAPAREIELRLFALALYCDKAYNSIFFKSVFFLRFTDALNFSHFERTAETLIKKNSLALVVFWTVFRLSFGNSVPQNSYIPLEEKMRKKSLELGLKTQSLSK
ncbi:MAG: hypothetical protein LBC75_10060 [Fibromonadaceae bacterium]|jgi:hypothetical protein|nr:hypothetical protein [Fibromonadaceae bacterium]